MPSDAAFREALDALLEYCAASGLVYGGIYDRQRARVLALYAERQGGQASAMPECDRLIASFRAQSNVGEAIGCAHEAINALRAALLAAEARVQALFAERQGEVYTVEVAWAKGGLAKVDVSGSFVIGERVRVVKEGT